MENHYYHKTTRISTKGKLSERLTPWIKEEKFKTKMLADPITGAMRPTSKRDKIVEGIFKIKRDIWNNPLHNSNLDILKKNNLIKDPKIRISTVEGAKKYPFIYNDYHCRVANSGYDRNKNGGFLNH